MALPCLSPYHLLPALLPQPPCCFLTSSFLYQAWSKECSDLQVLPHCSFSTIPPSGSLSPKIQNPWCSHNSWCHCLTFHCFLQPQWYHGSCWVRWGSYSSRNPACVSQHLPWAGHWAKYRTSFTLPLLLLEAKSAHREAWVQGLSLPLICQDISAQLFLQQIVTEPPLCALCSGNSCKQYRIVFLLG